MVEKLDFYVDVNNKNLRVDVTIKNTNPLISRNRIKNLILDSKLKINGKVIQDPSKKVSFKDYILLEIPEQKSKDIEPYDYKMHIHYEDKDLMIIDKPAGIIMHPGAGNYDKTIVNALIHYNKNSLSNIGGRLRPGIVHRIDKDTSGLVVVAKNNEAHRDLSEQFNKHSIVRFYKLLVWGKLRPSKGRLETLITRSSKNRQLMEVSKTKGKKAITNYETINIFENDKCPTLSLIKCKLETGRTHQIRVHMKYLGHSIVGDKKYKKRYKMIKNIDKEVDYQISKINRQFLHAEVLGFIHPKTKKNMLFSSNLPKDLEKLLKTLKKTSK